MRAMISTTPRIRLVWLAPLIAEHVTTTLHAQCVLMASTCRMIYSVLVFACIEHT